LLQHGISFGWQKPVMEWAHNDGCDKAVGNKYVMETHSRLFQAQATCYSGLNLNFLFLLTIPTFAAGLKNQIKKNLSDGNYSRHENRPDYQN
jgi:hypothetical protein